MKKVLLIGLIAAMGLGLAACGKHHSDNSANIPTTPLTPAKYKPNYGKAGKATQVQMDMTKLQDASDAYYHAKATGAKNVGQLRTAYQNLDNQLNAKYKNAEMANEKDYQAQELNKYENNK